ncbi:MAG TPA: family 10 glycosylhydrolase [Vicinamibacterales bacterium]|jgi:uncharacterized lipoprotein YddW (UPF0748 family)|nr:family 10 glycosylhydrolase [Vicinamibacterales bacterium]
MDAHELAALTRGRARMARPVIAPVLCAVMAALAALVPAQAAGPGDEVRALWVRRASLESEDAIRKMVASAATAGFNTLFVQAADDAAAPGFDPIGETVVQAHAAGLRVHAWVDVARVAAPGELPFARNHVVYQHPEWLMVPRVLAAELLAIDIHSPDYLGRLARWTRNNADRIDGLYISPLQPEVASHLADVVRDLARRYALDGVYLDHVQFPTTDFDFSAKSIAAFRNFMRGELPLAERQRIDAVEEIDPFAYPNELPDQWRLFRQSQLTALIARLRTTVKEARPAALVSAAVMSDAAVAARDNLQDWRTWLDNGFLDALCPMASGPDAAQMQAQLAEVHALAGGKPVWAGIGANRLSQRETLDDIGVARRAGAQGIILFSYDGLISPPKGIDYLSAIGRGAFAGS